MIPRKLAHTLHRPGHASASIPRHPILAIVGRVSGRVARVRKVFPDWARDRVEVVSAQTREEGAGRWAGKGDAVQRWVQQCDATKSEYEGIIDGILTRYYTPRQGIGRTEPS